MAGIEELQPSLSSDPNFRMWTQIRSLQQRISALEAKRPLVVRASFGESIVPGNVDGTQSNYSYKNVRFATAGRPLLVTFGPVTLLHTSGPIIDMWASIPGASSLAVQSRQRTTGVYGVSSVMSATFSNIPPGDYEARIFIPSADLSIANPATAHLQIFELPS